MSKRVWLALFLLALGCSGNVWAQTAASYINAGNQMYAAKDYAKAVQYYQAATGMDPNSAAAYQGLGNSHYGLGQKSEALAAYERALQINPNNPQLSTFVQSLRAQVGTAPPAANTSYPANTGDSSGGSKFELAPHAGAAYSLSTGYGIGFGGGLGGYIAAGGGLAFGGSAAYYTFGGPTFSSSGVTVSQSFSNIEVLASLKYRIGTGSMKPYLLAGAGLSLFSVTASASVSGFGGVSASASTTNPMAQAGGGLEFAAGNNMNIFVQGAASVIIGSGGTETYLPIQGGVSLNL